MIRRLLTVACAAFLFCVAAPPAEASTLIVRNAHSISLKVDRYNRAVVSYTAAGSWHHTLWWGAINANFPNWLHPDSQRRFRYDYTGGYRSFGAGYWRRARNVCGPYTGPALPLVVKACTMPGGSHWVLQIWRRLMPNGGWPCCRLPAQGAYELRISHFIGPPPRLWVKWNYSTRYTWGGGRHLDLLYGRYTYQGHGMFGFSSTPAGAPTDSYGILIWVDTYNSAWGSGWRRVNSFLTHKRSYGSFCDQLWPSRFGRSGSPGNGQRYRAFADGTNPLPVVSYVGPPPGNYSASAGTATRDQIGIFNILGWTRRPYNASMAQTLAQEQRALAGTSADGCYTTW